MKTRVKTATEIQAMRESGQMLAEVLSKLEKEVAVDMSSKDLSERAKELLRPLGGQPTFLGYQGFPDVLCVSINDEVVHGIPRATTKIKSGDIVSLDFGVTYRGMITDSALSVIAGKSGTAAQKLLDKTNESLYAGILEVAPGVKVGDIGYAIQRVLDGGDYGIVRDLVGHGVGHELHEEPNIPNHGRKGTGFRLEEGMTIALEPMATMGGYEVKVDNDGWTIRTRDGSMAAHFEHTILVTAAGSEVLTERNN
jgi:methionyl aminopeptidase